MSSRVRWRSHVRGLAHTLAQEPIIPANRTIRNGLENRRNLQAAINTAARLLQY